MDSVECTVRGRISLWGEPCVHGVGGVYCPWGKPDVLAVGVSCPGQEPAVRVVG